MSLSWVQRKNHLSSLLKNLGDEDAAGLALDRLLHSQNVISTPCTAEIDTLRFQDKDLALIGTLDRGQFGTIDIVTCQLDGCVYVRKSIEKRFALRTRDQCFPLFERDILLQARKTDSEWAPHLLCAFQTVTHLNLVMDYAQGGTLWDVLESSPYDGKVLEKDLKWWTPQIVSAIHWCHSQGFVHRDIKPHNFVLTADAHILLIDFGSAAPLLPPDHEGAQHVPKRYCLVPCGTCDYISPEILKAHEEALVALEMDDEEDIVGTTPKRHAEEVTKGYGLEIDWWSLGAMLYELAYGAAPFFASDIRQTYMRIINHERSLRFDTKSQLSSDYEDFLSRLLTHPHLRLGRRNIMEITEHPVFEGVDWSSLHLLPAPPDLHLPQFTYNDPLLKGHQPVPANCNLSLSQGFAFSALFQSSPPASTPVGASLPQRGVSEAASSPDRASFVGFSWGPPINAFNNAGTRNAKTLNPTTPDPVPSMHPNLPNVARSDSTPIPSSHRFSTPIRYAELMPFGTLPRASTVRRTAPRRTMSDREALKQLVDCIGMSARKKILESGRKPRILTSFCSMSRKELRFMSSPIPLPDYTASSPVQGPSRKRLRGGSLGASQIDIPTDDPYGSASEVTESDGPPSPSPRPGSAMSRRSGTPTISSMTSHPLEPISMSLNGGGSVHLSAQLHDHQGGAHASSRQADTAETGASAAVSSGRHRAMTVSCSAPSVFDMLEEQHATLMKDIRDLEQRLSSLSDSLE